jgi:hypothetical protein
MGAVVLRCVLCWAFVGRKVEMDDPLAHAYYIVLRSRTSSLQS